MAKNNKEIVNLRPVEIGRARIHIVGDGTLCLNKMNNRNKRTLTDQRKDRAKSMEVPNEWEDIITAIHWRDGDPTEFTEESLIDCLKNNAPCITAFGLKKSWGQAVVRNEIDSYATKFDNAVNITAINNLVPVSFSDHSIDEKLMSPKRGAPVLVRLNLFSGWTADIDISYTANVYSLDQIVNIINLAGFGLGIGSGRTSGYGRYHVESVIVM